MRDINRIERIIYKIGKLWTMYPDQRFFQLLSNYTPLGHFIRSKTDPFWFEDDGLEAYLDGVLNNIGKEIAKENKRQLKIKKQQEVLKKVKAKGLKV